MFVVYAKVGMPLQGLERDQRQPTNQSPHQTVLSRGNEGGG